MRAALLPLALLCGCADYRTIQVELTLDEHEERILVPDREIQEILDGAEAITGYRIDPVSYSTIKVELVNTRAKYSGRAWRDRPCNFHVRSSYHSIVLAHEIGHVLGLDHVPQAPTRAEDNFMVSDAAGTNVTRRQQEVMRKNAKRIERLCWNSTDADFFRQNPTGSSLGREPEQLCDQSEVGGIRDGQEDVVPGVGPEQAGTGGGDETGSTGIRGSGKPDSNWSFLLQWL